MESEIVKRVKEEVMNEAFEKVLKYLKLMKRNIARIDKDDRAVVVLEEIEDYKERMRILIKVFNENWMSIMAILISEDEIQNLRINESDLLRKLLRLSFRAAEYNFAMDIEGNILIKEDIHLGALSFDVFEEEYFAIPSAIRTFRTEILPKLDKGFDIDFSYV